MMKFDEDLNLMEYINNIANNYIIVNNNDDVFEHNVEIPDYGANGTNIISDDTLILVI